MRMIDRFYEFLGSPLLLWSRVALIVVVIPLALSFWYPLWRIELSAPQYPSGLELEIYSHTLQGGNNGQHLQEINTLNHYIGMRHIDRAELSDLDWLPFALGALALYALRVAIVGTVRSLIDLTIMTVYAGGFGLARFAYKLWVFGHNLDPQAPFKVEPFMPAMLGTKQIANFTTTSLPQVGTFLVGAYTVGVLGITVWHLFYGRKRAIAQAKTSPAAAA
ncbi:MAG: hypothetical protein IT384_03045 [Deltaproteobacteria bacterium]|nr:hypothetical protein [Deltaproteobacteria bacterium]